jgi:SAM-dependent methyltransferase
MKNFPSIFARYDIEFPDRLYNDKDFIREVIQKNHYRTVLDVACGTGRSSIELLSLGADVTGVDVNSEALEIYQNKARMILNDNQLNLLNLDINVELPKGQWELILFVGNSIGILPDKQKLDRFFEFAKSHLTAMGSLLVTMTFPENGAAQIGVEQPRRNFTLPDGWTYERSHSTEVTNEFTYINLNYWKNDQLFHKETLQMTRFSWNDVYDIASNHFDKKNISMEFFGANHGPPNGSSHYEVFFKFGKS